MIDENRYTVCSINNLSIIVKCKYCTLIESYYYIHAMHNASFAFGTWKQVSPKRSGQVNFDF